MVKKFLVIFIIFFIAVLTVSFVSAASVGINANIPSHGGPPPPPPPPPPVPGCTDPLATNYNSSATVNDGSCIYNIYGCTDPLAINYNPSATVDDGSCVLPVLGCTDPLATNYNPLANTDNGTCAYAVSGCMDPTATNYNPLATIDNGSCIYQVSGCTNPLADNYNPLATLDDGSCIISGCTNPLATNYNSQATIDNGSCLISGCTDPTAVNYNSQATIDNGSCSYDPEDIAGCTDASAINYNSQATVDNGSCAYLIAGCTDTSALNYNPSAGVNNGSCVYRLPFVPIGSNFELDYNFFTNNNNLQLFLQNNNIDLLINYDLLMVLADNFSKPVQKITATINGEILPFKYDVNTKQYILQLKEFISLDKTTINLSVVYQDNSVAEKNITVTTHPLGHIFSKLPQDQTRIFGITVKLYDENNNVVRQLDRISADGTYGFMVRNGKYRLVVYDNGEKIYDGRLFNVKNNIINRDIGLTLWEQLVKVVKEVLDNPIVEETNDYVAPTAVSVVAVSTFVAMPWWSFINYFQSFFTEPLAWLFRRKKKGWGVVYNSITKKPIDLAVVRLYDKTTGKLLKSRVTDKQGRYSFLVSDGSYTLQVVKPNMVFPSNILKNISEDKQFVNLYHGDDIIIGKDQKGIITANIPVDPSDAPITDKEVIRQNIKYKIHKNISLLGPILALVSLAVSPTILIGLFAVLHILLYFIFNRLIAKEKVNKWGVILDAKTGQPVAGTVTKIYSPEYNKMLEAQVTDRHGRYGFLAGNNVYYIAATKDGYLEAKTDNIDLTHKKSEEVIGQDLELHPMDNQSPIDNSQQNEITKSLKTETQNHAKPAYRQAGTENTKTEEDTKPIKQSEEKEESPLKELADKLNQEAEKNIPLPTSTSIPEPTSEPIPEPTSNISSDLDNQTGDRVEAPKEQIEPVVINKPESESKFG